ncbi:YGR131W [Saccharomyces arboricola H-6]|uniref:YGR131W n=1 Tax=Saccharomyces arboricola (strain H-6 / AS 2.3317 / CBS 10644) TaxID=1160507 RepID=J8Q4U3_SACAR|nr:YGR131W [Saccharomyces arboricola H-6]
MLSAAENLIRITNAVFLIISIGLISGLLGSQKKNSSRVNFCMFTAAYGLLTDSFYGFLANFWSSLIHPVILLVLDFLNFVFTFVAATALAVGIRCHSCKNKTYLEDNKITQGSSSRCHQSQAAVAFFYFSCFLFLVKLIVSVVGMLQNDGFGSNAGVGRRRARRQMGVPTISQV